MKSKSPIEVRSSNPLEQLSISSSIILTPRRQTIAELRRDGVSPKSLPRSIVKELDMANAVNNEVLESVKTNPKAKRLLITKVLTGRLVKKINW